MPDKPWEPNVIHISESYQESYPTGKGNFQQIHFGPLYESKFLHVPQGTITAGDEAIDDYILEARRKMHCRLVTAVTNMVNKAIDDKRIIGIQKR